jgi:hypothetical protein
MMKSQRRNFEIFVLEFRVHLSISLIYCDGYLYILNTIEKSLLKVPDDGISQLLLLNFWALSTFRYSEKTTSFVNCNCLDALCSFNHLKPKLI